MNVSWTEDAKDRLADIWAAAEPADRDVLERTVQAINSRLAVDPANVGESRSGQRRVWFNHPLMVIFRLVPGGEVRVSHVVRLRGTSAGDAE